MRARFGCLKLSRVNGKTQARYRGALIGFDVFCQMTGQLNTSTEDELDKEVQQYVKALWSEGESTGAVGLPLSGLQWATQKKRILSCSWELFRSWN